MRRRFRRSLLLLACVVLAACGGAPAATTAPTAAAVIAATRPGPTPTPAATPPARPTATPAPTVDPLLEAIYGAIVQTARRRTVNVDIKVRIVGSRVLDDITMAAVGSGSLGTPTQLTFAADWGDIGLGHMDVIVDDTRMYMRGKYLDVTVGKGNWLLVDTESDDPRAASFAQAVASANDMRLTIHYLWGATRVEKLHGETVQGLVTQHYRLDVDLEKAAFSAPDAVQDELFDNVAALRIGGVDTDVVQEVWVGADGLIHRLQVAFTLHQSAGGGSVTRTYLFSSFGTKLELPIPDESDTVRLEDIPAA
jgi:hypothetical protein